MALTRQEISQRYRKRHLGAIKTRQRKWYQDNLLHVREQKREYMRNHREEAKSRKEAERNRFGKKCEICSEMRVLDVCHIIPDRLGGPREFWNILRLCPNHHRLFDADRLDEYEKAFIAAKLNLARNKFQRGR